MIRYFFENPFRIFEALNEKGFHWLFSDKQFIKIMYFSRFKKKLNLYSPKLFTEKLQWIKLYDRNPLYTKMVDKYLGKEYAASIIGKEYIVPTLGIWESFDQIDFSKLPDKFVLKCTHDSGGNIICKNKDTFSIQNAKLVINKSLKRNYYIHTREWPYKDVLPRIIAEEYLEDKMDGELRDYKFFTFHGEPYYLYIAQGRGKGGEVYADFFDMSFNHLDLRIDHNNAPRIPHVPKNFELMKEFARKLSKYTRELRVDFYEVNERLYLGEMTFFHCSGFAPFCPPEWDEKWGELIKI